MNSLTIELAAIFFLLVPFIFGSTRSVCGCSPTGVISSGRRFGGLCFYPGSPGNE